MQEKQLPRHVGLIMDGNGRWAKKRGMPRYYGHSVGAKTFRKIAEYCSKIGIEYLTVYAFSTENWKRPEKEVNTILKLMRDYLKDFESYRDLNMKIRFLGDLSIFDQEMRDMIANLEYESSFATGMNLNIAINYGGRNEIVMASRKIAEKVASGSLKPEEIQEEFFSEQLYTAGMPDVDLVIRPSGEQRLSNFLIWQCAYAEFVYMDVLWPDFSTKDMDAALEQYVNRNRRFGGV
jgi:undecaprenyl diphosphate synthase